MRWLHGMVLFLAASALAGCSGLGLLNATVSLDGYRIERDIAFGPDPRQRYDLYVPEGASGSAPVVVFFYGGAWTGGRKQDYLFVGEALATRGYVVAIPDYRVFPQIRFPEFLADNAAAVSAIRRDLAARNLASGALALVGHSAGAYNAAMLALDPQWLAKAGVDRCRDISAVVALAGPYDFLPLNGRSLKAVFGEFEPLAETQPISFAQTPAPPMLLLAGRNDATVLPRNTLALAAAMRAAGGRVQTKLYDNVAHADIVASFAKLLRGTPPSLDDTDRFLAANRGAGC
jgi:acetyl esterase/lipase